MYPTSLECECGNTDTVDETQIGKDYGTSKVDFGNTLRRLNARGCGKNARVAGGRELIIKSIDIETEVEKMNLRAGNM